MAITLVFPETDGTSAGAADSSSTLSTAKTSPSGVPWTATRAPVSRPADAPGATLRTVVSPRADTSVTTWSAVPEAKSSAVRT